jgi:hypothetical protein
MLKPSSRVSTVYGDVRAERQQEICSEMRFTVLMLTQHAISRATMPGAVFVDFAPIGTGAGLLFVVNGG